MGTRHVLPSRHPLASLNVFMKWICISGKISGKSDNSVLQKYLSFIRKKEIRGQINKINVYFNKTKYHWYKSLLSDLRTEKCVYLRETQMGNGSRGMRQSGLM